MKKLLCLFGFHSYHNTEDHYRFTMKIANDSKRGFKGWSEFRRCEGCGKIQARHIRTNFFKIYSISEFKDIDDEGTKILNQYRNE